jgi:ABC-type multidrug transport system ATPase subunit
MVEPAHIVQAEAEAALAARHVAKSFGRRPVLRGVTFEVRGGEIAGVVGENGAGKSTLLKILVGLLAPSGGEVEVRGRVGFCPQDLMVYEALTVAENMEYFATAYGMRPHAPRSTFPARKAELLERLGFVPYEHTRVSRLSGGTKQKLNLCLALLHVPDVLILDEPYAGFDWETYLRFWELAGSLRTQGGSILVVSHLVHDRSRFDRLYELQDGLLRCV